MSDVNVLAPVSSLEKYSFDLEYGAGFSEVVQELSADMELTAGRKEEFRIFYISYSQFQRMWILRTWTIPEEYLRKCFSAERIADLFYLYEVYQFNVIDLLQKNHTQGILTSDEGVQTRYVFNKTGHFSLILTQNREDTQIELGKAVRGSYGLNPEYYEMTKGKNLGNFLIKAHLFLVWFTGENAEDVQIAANGMQELRKYYRSIGAEICAPHRALFRLFGGLDAAILTPEQARFLKKQKCTLETMEPAEVGQILSKGKTRC
ncbi:MAG: hypothetical protein JW774_01760 [Candidatus Aureabacteria bacterium]|nr:hypothetical protein [Candidatus Auribacterota bacterium]